MKLIIYLSDVSAACCRVTVKENMIVMLKNTMAYYDVTAVKTSF